MGTITVKVKGELGDYAMKVFQRQVLLRFVSNDRFVKYQIKNNQIVSNFISV